MGSIGPHWYIRESWADKFRRWKITAFLSVLKYLMHAIANLKVAGRCFILFLFHAVHAFLPFKITSHEFWRIK